MARLHRPFWLWSLGLLGAFSLAYYYHQIGAQPRLNFDISRLAGQTDLVPVVIIGSGPAGLGAGIYCARAGWHTVILDGSKPGGLLMGTSMVENWPGEKQILGPTLIEKLRVQNQALGVKFATATVSQVDFQQWPFTITTTDGLKIHALTVVIATGANPKTLQIPGEAEYWGKGVSACAICDAPYFKDEQVVVVGGGDSALEEALQLAPHAAQVTILVRGDKLRASVRMQQRVQAIANIKICYRTQLTQISGDGTKVTAVELSESGTNGTVTTTRMPISGVFLAIGYQPNTKLFQGQLALTSAGYITTVGRTQATSVPGVFAAGEVDDDYYRQAGIACAEGNKAALDVDRFLQSIGVNSQIVSQVAKRYYQPAVATQDLVGNLNTLADFEREVVNSPVPVLLDFWAPSCPTCKQMLPNITDLAAQFAGKLKVFKVNADTADELVSKFYVLQLPSLVICAQGKAVAQVAGFMDKAQLRAWLDKYVA